VYIDQTFSHKLGREIGDKINNMGSNFSPKPFTKIHIICLNLWNYCSIVPKKQTKTRKMYVLIDKLTQECTLCTDKKALARATNINYFTVRHHLINCNYLEYKQFIICRVLNTIKSRRKNTSGNMFKWPFIVRLIRRNKQFFA
jgi:hypothetical protein